MSESGKGYKDPEAHAAAKEIVLYPYRFRMIEFDEDRHPSTCRTGTHRPCRGRFLVVRAHVVYRYPFELRSSALGRVLDWLVALPVSESCLL